MDMEVYIDEWIWIKYMSNGYGLELLCRYVLHMKQE